MKPLILHPHFGEIGSVAQLYSALDFGSSGWGLESLRGHKKKPSTKVPGFLLLGASKIYFDLRIKQKRRELRSSLGFYAWIESKIGKTRQRNPSGVTRNKKAPFLSFWGFFFYFDIDRLICKGV